MDLSAVLRTNGTQEFLYFPDTPQKTHVSVLTMHTKLNVTGTDAYSIILPVGSARGQLKLITLCQLDHPEASVDVLPVQPYLCKSITFSQKGDQALLLWNGNNWVVLSSYNLLDPAEGPDVEES